MDLEFDTLEPCVSDEILVRIDADVLPGINYAMQQHGAVAIQSVTVRNLSDEDLENVDLQITAAPSFALPLTQHIDRIAAHKSVTVSRPKLMLCGEYLAGLTEKVAGVLQIELQKGEETLVSERVETTVFAFDEWHGLEQYPELLAAFVTPNHPELARIIACATEFLGEWTGDTSMDGYQSQDSNRVLQQAAAIFTAIKEQAIAYVVPPASFEKVGQRVRLCDMVLQQKLGTCLDLTLLYASCLEAVGIHPLLIVTEGHIFTGFWLEDRMFPECLQDDFSLITKRLASGVNEIAVVETTAVTTGKDISFDGARELGEKMLSKNENCIIDVQRARLSHIYPLPQRVAAPGGWEIVHDTSFMEENMAAPTQLDETIHLDPNMKDGNLPKKAQWERKLLDLGMRNTLINLRMTKTKLPILSNSLDELENALADGSDFTILPKPADFTLPEFSFEALSERGAAGIIRVEFENKRLRSVLTETELAKSIKDLYRTAKTSLEENGANTLYLALGMLRWYETKRSTKARYAPIILIPIEMVRKSAVQGYVIRLRDEEPQMNITLLEKLKQDFGIDVLGLDPLPCDEHGVDIRMVLTVMRQAVMEQTRWDVLECANIGIFSFSQFVMWNDIRNRTEDLMRNKVVRSLMDGQLCWEAEPMDIGDQVNENDVLLPMPADASQLYAIQAACNGESFVLHGPPGTGKSQTITSLIANALAQGKSVLFVAEKMAALQVVQKRLENIGVGPFCLELHSNKSKKKDVLEQLRRATEVTKTTTAEEYEAKARQLAAMRQELSGYVSQLHRLLPCGKDLYALINEYELYRDGAPLPEFSREFIRTLTRPLLEQQELALERLVASGQEIGHPHDHPLQYVGCIQYTQSLRTSLSRIVQDYIAQIDRLSDPVKVLSEVLYGKEPESFHQLQKLVELTPHMLCWYEMPPLWTTAANPAVYFTEVLELAQQSCRAGYLEGQLLSVFEPGILALDGATLFAEYTEASGKWLVSRMVGINKLVKTLNTCAKAPIEKEKLQGYITMLRDSQQARRSVAPLLQKYIADLGVFFNGKETDWGKLAQLAHTANNAARSLYELYGSYDILGKCGNPELREAITGLQEGFRQFTEAKTVFDKTLVVAQLTQPQWLENQRSLCQTILEHADEMKEWIAFVGAAEEVNAAGLQSVVESYRNGTPHEDLYGAYKKAVLQGLIGDAIDDSETLNQFSGTVFNKKLEQYKQMDQTWTSLSRQEAYCRLAAKVPNFTKEAAQSSELGILQRCIKSGGRGVSIRKLLDQIPNLLPRLCPCMLMSPISAAQYLDPKREPFDIVVFDEASQLPTCKAVGVLARGENAIIVGDPKQMPPTSFFATNTADEEQLELEDLESILDDCLALNMPQSHLLWHYRSRHESLIAFSNRRFYENKLFTFPSVNDRASKVRLVPVDGQFDRGKSRTNRAEAEAVVEELKRRCADPDLSNESVGVVTFNIAQQHLIDDLLTEACARDAKLEQWVVGGDEPVFIKNLETVQGDERDVILFSIGFGPDSNGKISMNFGPLNREGGWRRLNVAVSRARCEMVVFSTIRPEQLDLNRTEAEGVAALRGFLEYAQGRTAMLEESEKSTDGDGIALSIGKALKEDGYETDLNIGRSAYRVDIGVVDPENPDQYILGIMLDGPSYGAAKTTRDRELAQISVLGGLGWNILRIWSMDWWDNREKELSRIRQKLQDLKKPAEEPPVEEPEEPEQLPQRLGNPNAEPLKLPPVYKAVELPENAMSADYFVVLESEKNIRSCIEATIAAEAPISLSLLTKRVVQSYGITRAGSRIQNRLDGILAAMNLRTTAQDGTVFYWQDTQTPDFYTTFRVNGEEDDRRDIRDVPVQEVANAIYVVLYEQISMTQEDLLRETANKLGYTRLGNNVLSVLEAGISFAREGQFGITEGANGSIVLSASGTARAETILQSF